MSRPLACLATLLVLYNTPCSANTKHAPLPEKLLKAKTVYIDNHGSAKLRDQAYEELKKWGRFSIVEKRDGADIVLVLASEPGRSTTGTTSTYHPSTDGGYGQWSHGTVNTSSRACGCEIGRKYLLRHPIPEQGD